MTAHEPVQNGAATAKATLEPTPTPAPTPAPVGKSKKDYKGFVGGVFSGIAKLSGE